MTTAHHTRLVRRRADFGATVEDMDLTWVALTVAGALSVAGLPFAMAWVEQTFMTDTRVKQPPRS